MDTTVDRRSMLKVAAWSMPVIALAAAAPAVAASPVIPVLTALLGPIVEPFRDFSVVVRNAEGDPLVGVTPTRQIDFATFGWIDNGLMPPTGENGLTTDIVFAPGFERYGYRAWLEVDGVRYYSDDVPNT